MKQDEEKRGRPKKDRSELRCVLVMFRATEAERDGLKDRARRAKTTVSDLIRRLLGLD